MATSITSEIYAIVARAPRPGDLFEQLCQSVLRAMNFEHIYERRGAEQGRDIDARLAGFTWFFECKFVQKDVDTAQFAYKFLQLDMLKKSERPDFFVLMSNGSITSILKDIIQFKASDRYTTYSVELWANQDSDRVFDDILLSSSEEVAAFFHRQCPETLSLPFWNSFLQAGQHHVRANHRFIDRLLDTPLFRSRSAPSTKQLSRIQFIHDATFAKVRDTSSARLMTHIGMVMVGVPDASRFGLLDCSSLHGKRQLVKDFAPWGMELEEEEDRSILAFAEGFSVGGTARTLMCEWGGIATWQEIPFAQENTVVPSELFPIIKEHSLRFRNYMKRGTLVTPCSVWLRIHNFGFESKKQLLGDLSGESTIRFRNIEQCYLGGCDPFKVLEDRSFFGPKDGDFICEGPLVTTPIKLHEPPEEYRVVGGPLSESLWSLVSGGGHLLATIRSVESTLRKNWVDRKDRQSWDCLIELGKGFNYLLDEDLFYRPYEIFQKGKR